METINASVVEIAEKYSIKIQFANYTVMIPMSEDNPSEVKSAFNKLILRLKDGAFQIELQDIGNDLFSQVAKEYISQLNREVQEVYSEMLQHDLASR